MLAESSVLGRLIRRKYWKYPFLDKKFQFYVALVLAAIGAINAFYFSVLFYFYTEESFLRLAQWIPDYVSPEVLARDQYSLWIKTIAFIGTFEVFLVALFGLFFSHRMAGPLYAMSLRLKSIAAGMLPQPVKLRKDDLLTDFADRLNEAIASLSQRQTEIHGILEDAEAGRMESVKTRLRRLTASEEESERASTSDAPPTH